VPRADFYLIDKPRFRENPLLLVCELAKMAFAQQIPTLVHARSQEQADQLDELLWEFDPDGFIGHQIAGDEDDAYIALLIVPPDVDSPLRPLVINLRDSTVPGRPESVKEVVPADPAERDGSRQRWTDYKSRGFDLRKFDM
jgi:DNA polymerase III subunit chi